MSKFSIVVELQLPTGKWSELRKFNMDTRPLFETQLRESYEFAQQAANDEGVVYRVIDYRDGEQIDCFEFHDNEED